MDISGVAFGPQIAAAATAHHLDPALLAAVAAQETGGPAATSGRNIVGDGGHGHGVFQIDDRSWDFAKTPAAMDPAKNANVAASILADNLQRYGGNVREALSAYNSGSPSAAGTTTTWGDGATLGYADSVLRHYDALSGSTNDQLVAERGETSSSVNALANYASSSAPALGSSAGTGATVAPSEATMLAALGPYQMAAFQAAPAISYTTSGSQTAAAVGAEGDKQLGTLLDASDGLGSDDDQNA